MHDLNWSRSERAIARVAFERALGQELQAVMQEAKIRAAAISEPSQLWDLEQYLTQRRHHIDQKYQFRSGALVEVFAILLTEGRIREADLHGISEDKLNWIRLAAQPFEAPSKADRPASTAAPSPVR